MPRSLSSSGLSRASVAVTCASTPRMRPAVSIRSWLSLRRSAPICSISRLSAASVSIDLLWASRAALRSWSRCLSASSFSVLPLWASSTGRSCASTAAASVTGNPSASTATSADRESNPPRQIIAATLGPQVGTARRLFHPDYWRRIKTDLRRSCPMIRMAGEDRRGAVKLFQQHDAHQLVRPGGGAERQPQLGLGAQARRQAIGAADHKDHGRPVVCAPFRQLGGETGAVEVVAVGVEQYDRRALRNDVGERNRLLEHALGGVVRAAFPDFDDFDVAQTEIAPGLRRALAEALGKFGFRALFQASDDGHDDTHRAAECISLCAALPTTSFRDCRSFALPAGTRARSRRRRRSAPNRLAASLRHGCR